MGGHFYPRKVEAKLLILVEVVNVERDTGLAAYRNRPDWYKLFAKEAFDCVAVKAAGGEYREHIDAKTRRGARHIHAAATGVRLGAMTPKLAVWLDEVGIDGEVIGRIGRERYYTGHMNGELEDITGVSLVYH